MHWKNSSFQVAAFVVGKCHTADEAYRKLLLLREERESALKSARIADLRIQASVLKAREGLKADKPEWERLEAQASLAEIEAGLSTRKSCIDEAVRELQFIDELLALIAPFRKYTELPDHVAFQLIQREEWCLELIDRAQNYLYCTGTIPPDHFSTMRAHPDFATAIRPLIGAMYEALKTRDMAKLATFTVVPSFMRALADAKVFGPQPDLKQLVVAVRRELDAPKPESR